MKLKLLALSIFLLLVAVGYTTYQKYNDIKSVKTYDGCIALKSSSYTSTTPSFCITKLGITFVEPTPTSTPQSLPIPVIKGWKKYTDSSTSHSNFTFEYPDFMPDPSTYWQGESILRFISTYSWQSNEVDSSESWHGVDLRIQGLYPETINKELQGWIKEQGWPHQVGEIQEVGGSSRVSYVEVDNTQAMQSVFTVTGAIYPSSWVLYFKTTSGIYRIDLNVQVSEKDLEKYQSIFPHILSSFEFIK